MADNNDGWIKVTKTSDGSGDFKNWMFRTDKEIEGIYKGVRDVTRKDNTTTRVYDIETAGGVVSAWEYPQLKSGMSEVPLGSRVKIAYLGLAQSTKNPTRKYHNFEVYHQPAQQNNGEDLPF